MKTIITLICLFFFSLGCGEDNQIERSKIESIILETKQSVEKDIEEKLKQKYYDGFNDALERLVLLNLEFDIKGIRKNYGEMFDTLRTRWDIPQSKK